MAEQVEYFGIDFGTTNIAVSGLVIDQDKKKAYKTSYGDEDGVPYPAIIAVKPKDDGTDNLRIKFGRSVKTQIAAMQDNGYTIIKSIKTNLGSNIVYDLGTQKLTPVGVTYGLVRSIKKYLTKREARSADIKRATVAVPVDFSDKQRIELIKAFTNAGITVDKLISESVAAYIRNRDEVKGLTNVMVFDWGGGTLDISLLRSEGGQVFEEATDGWKVAGDYIDEKIAEYVHNQLVISPDYHITKPYDSLNLKERLKLLDECEKAKIRFSDEDDIDRPAMISMMDYCGEKSVRFKLTYEVFCQIIKPIVLEAIRLIDKVLEKANKTRYDLHAIIMVGGSSKLLPLRAVMENEFQQKNNIIVKIVYPKNPQWSVAEGAALIQSIDCQYKLNQEICVVMSDNSSHPIVRKGADIPFGGEPVTFGTVNGATTANFIFADDKGNYLGDITMPTKGFLGEYFEVICNISNRLVAEISVTGKGILSSAKTKPSVEVNQLSYYFDLSALNDYQFEVYETVS